MAVALLFIDGVGVGRRDPEVNPLARRDYLLSRFAGSDGEAPLPHGGLYIAVDPTFGVPGRPQSASNQTAILTGLAAPSLTGEHVLGFPNRALRSLLAEHSIVRRLVEAGRTVTFANTYPAGYLDALELARRPSAQADVEIPARALRRIRASASTLAMAAGNVALRTLDDARGDQGLTHDITGRRSRLRGFDTPLRSPQKAAAILLSLIESHDFVMFEHYLADEAGHAQDAALAEDALTTFDDFAREVVSRRGEHHVLICSDHGNVEDLSTRGHTLNPVPVLYFGGAEGLSERMKTVADVGTSILALLGASRP